MDWKRRGCGPAFTKLGRSYFHYFSCGGIHWSTGGHPTIFLFFFWLLTDNVKKNFVIGMLGDLVAHFFHLSRPLIFNFYPHKTCTRITVKMREMVKHFGGVEVVKVDPPCKLYPLNLSVD